MEKFFIYALAVTFFTLASGVPTWEYEDDVTPSSLEITHRRCSCAKNHHECGCCLQIKAHPFHKRIDADVCMNASYVESPLGAEFFLTWNKDVLFNKTISAADPPPICFGIPHLRFPKGCVKFSNVSIEKHNTGGCVALEFKGFDAGRDIRLGCFFFRGADSNGFDMETFLDTESLHSLLDEVFQASTGGQIDTARIPYLETMDDEVTDLVTVDKAGCECGKTPPHCDCCVQAKVFHFPVKACVHGDVDKSDTGFNVAVIVNGLTVFKKHISVANPPPICHEFRIFHTKTKICLKLTEVSLAPGHTGACVEVDINSFKRSLGCFYMARQVTKERSTWLARHHG